MHKIITYRPYQSQGYFAPFAFGLGMLYLVALGYYLPNFDGVTFLFLVFASLSIWCAKQLYNSSNIVISFTHEGIRIFGGKYNNDHYINWRDISYAYYVRNHQAHLFLVLSPKELDQKQVRQFMKQSAIFTKLCIDATVIIHLDPMQDASALKELIYSKVSCISEE